MAVLGGDAHNEEDVVRRIAIVIDRESILLSLPASRWRCNYFDALTRVLLGPDFCLNFTYFVKNRFLDDLVTRNDAFE